MVELKNVSKSYTEGKQTRLILDDITTHFQPGKFILLLGHSGSGGSTSALFFSFSTGAVTVEGSHTGAGYVELTGYKESLRGRT